MIATAALYMSRAMAGGTDINVWVWLVSLGLDVWAFYWLGQVVINA